MLPMQRLSFLLFAILVNVSLANSSTQKIQSRCREHYTKLHGKCYYIEQGQKVNFYKAFEICRAQNAELLTIENASEMEQLQAHLSKLPGNIYWTSGHDLTEKGKYYWFSNGHAFAYQNWATNQPDHKDGERCVAIEQYAPQYLWNDLNCNGNYSYICEQKPVIFNLSFS